MSTSKIVICQRRTVMAPQRDIDTPSVGKCGENSSGKRGKQGFPLLPLEDAPLEGFKAKNRIFLAF